MKENLRKYAQLLLKRCLCLNYKRPLLVTAPIKAIDFIEVLTHEAYQLGINDIYFDWYDDDLKHEQLLHLSDEELVKSPFWNKVIYDEYAKKNAAFLMLCSDDIDLMNDIPEEKITLTSRHNRASRPLFREMQRVDEVPWCIALVPTLGYAKKVFPDSLDPIFDMWDAIFKCCLVYEENPIEAWDMKVKRNQSRCDLLNNYQFQFLHYTNSLGTDLIIELPKNHIWSGAGKENKDGLPLIVNMPSEEVFTSPKYDGVNGIVYSARPLVYSGALIDNFSFRFENGKVIEVKAEKGQEILENMIKTDEGASYLGEVALVDYDSPISNTNIIFYETLYDENASCHLALGDSFPSCLLNGENMSKEKLRECGLNQSNVHTDFMVGTSDLKIIGITFDGEEKNIFENGNFILR
jgi:aminopeptidase